jgi:DNA-binding CsgD family transcriptional regulator
MQVLERLPRSLRASAQAVLAARGRASELRQVLAHSRVPMVIVDNDRRYLEVNSSAQLFWRLSLAEMRQMRLDDLTLPDRMETMRMGWKHLMEAGSAVGTGQITTPDGARYDTTYWGMANVLPGEHVVGFALVRFEGEPGGPDDGAAAGPVSLTPRELELLQLAADGLSGPKIAEELVLSPATVRTHFANIYEKLDVSDRAGAVAKAMRLGLIS